MKVKELIEKLQAFDPELPILVDGYEFGLNPPAGVDFIRASEDPDPQEYGGIYDYEEMEDLGFQAVLISRP